LTISTTFPPPRGEQPPGDADLGALGLSLRHPTDADWPFLQRLFASFRAEEMALVGWPQAHKDALLNDQFRLQHHHLVTYFSGADFWIVERADRSGAMSPLMSPLGRLYLDRSTALWRVVDIGFLPEARRQGLGSALLKWAQRSALDAGAAGIDLHVVVVNAPAQSLYRKLGFQIEDEPDGIHQRMVWRPGPRSNAV
jgi:GNAT superfamily N-acetyltransferase